MSFGEENGPEGREIFPGGKPDRQDMPPVFADLTAVPPGTYQSMLEDDHRDRVQKIMEQFDHVFIKPEPFGHTSPDFESPAVDRSLDEIPDPETVRWSDLSRIIEAEYSDIVNQRSNLSRAWYENLSDEEIRIINAGFDLAEEENNWIGNTVEQIAKEDEPSRPSKLKAAAKKVTSRVKTGDPYRDEKIFRFLARHRERQRYRIKQAASPEEAAKPERNDRIFTAFWHKFDDYRKRKRPLGIQESREVDRNRNRMQEELREQREREIAAFKAQGTGTEGTK